MGEQDEMTGVREESRKVGKTTGLRIRRPFVHSFTNYLRASTGLVAADLRI